ncbi:hypothetical protein E4665_13625 [Sporolactobacillus shoreae]|uniref:DUF2712 domain-containing protein n=1 Tax=Sporolactobacillus shoreae TaxID=1465501 RepID=A0A4Z0GL78_9BACL|nr:hypothetical protein [Sporolactobacillus shoreae]TGA96897.1 hypothetical protein E4665_13625 [Sporolactobacillus shoreae]
MVMVKRKLYVTVLAVVVILSVSSLTAFASNYTDTSFSYGFGPGSTTQYTGDRLKTNNTSAYMKLESISGSDPNPSYTASVVKSSYSNFSKTWYYTFNRANINQGRYLSNYAFEDAGEVYVRIKGTANSVHGFGAYGVWSPDSI